MFVLLRGNHQTNRALRPWLICAVYYTCILHISSSPLSFSWPLTCSRFIKKVPDPWFGEQLVVSTFIYWKYQLSFCRTEGCTFATMGSWIQRVRLLLRSCRDEMSIHLSCTSFFGLFGIYYSLDYLSLSDATTLTFVTPVCTGIFGAVFLSEIFGRREVCIGLLSLVGVVFIARPTFIFGERGIDDAEHATPQQRLIAVGCVWLFFISDYIHDRFLFSVSGIGVLGGAGACKLYALFLFQFPCSFLHLRYIYSRHRTACASFALIIFFLHTLCDCQYRRVSLYSISSWQVLKWNLS